MTNEHTTSLLLLGEPPACALPASTSDRHERRARQDRDDRQLLENMHEGEEILILLLEILTVGCGPLPLPRCLPARIHVRLSGGSLLSRVLVLLYLLRVMHL